MAIDRIYNFENDFFRMISVSLCRTLYGKINWINRFEDKKIRVVVPFYVPFGADSRFVLDAYVDDITGKRITLNTDQIPRGMVKMTSVSSQSAEFANPNQYIAKKSLENGRLRKLFSKVKAIPMLITYDIEVILMTVEDVDKFLMSVHDYLFPYFFFNIDYYGIKIDAALELPDDKAIEIPEQSSLDEADRKKTIKFGLNVHTYYPMFRDDCKSTEVCDNDDDINWEYIGRMKPSRHNEIEAEIIDLYKELNKATDEDTITALKVQIKTLEDEIAEYCTFPTNKVYYYSRLYDEFGNEYTNSLGPSFNPPASNAITGTTS
jgi:hypothetical protein